MDGKARLAHSFPLNMGLPSKSSANIHPIDQTSTRRLLQVKLTERGSKEHTCGVILPGNIQISSDDYKRLSAVKYLNASIISGALYHRVATYSVRCVVVWSGPDSNPLLSPKSQIFSSQSAFTSRFPGFKSLCITEAE
jgi:hypothetical protein